MLALPSQLTHEVDIAQELQRLVSLSPATGSVQVNASTLDQLDSSCVALLLDWQRQLAARNQTLVLHGPTPALAALLQVYGVDELLVISSV
ncbi:MAG: putative binding protein involved in toluene tolerance [Pseudomonadota bacterium]|jgi:phospholipid transport system transporter-binding protein